MTKLKNLVCMHECNLIKMGPFFGDLLKSFTFICHCLSFNSFIWMSLHESFLKMAHLFASYEMRGFHLLNYSFVFSLGSIKELYFINVIFLDYIYIYITIIIIWLKERGIGKSMKRWPPLKWFKRSSKKLWAKASYKFQSNVSQFFS